MFVIGIVGAPAGGKSTVAAILAELGGAWINADLIAREVLEDDGVQQVLINRFGDSVVGEGGRIDRKRLATIVFGDDDFSQAALKYLESVIHPRTRERIEGRIRSLFRDDPRGAIALLDVPLLFESAWDVWCDEVVCVDTSDAFRLRRAASRGWTPDELRRRDNHQWPMTEKRRRSTRVFANDGGLDDLRSSVTAWFQNTMESIRQDSLAYSTNSRLPRTIHC